MTRVLIPVEILAGQTVPPGLIDLLGTVDVTVLGYYEVPEQTPPDQARAQFEEQAVSALEDIEDEFRAAGGGADHRLVFTRDRDQSIQRVAADIGADAYVIPGATGQVERILVPINESIQTHRIVSFVAALIGDRDIAVTVLLPASPEGDSYRDSVVDAFSDGDIGVTVQEAEGRFMLQIESAAAEHDVIVIGEWAPSLFSFIFGDQAEWIASASVGPVLVVRSPETVEE